MRRFLCCLALLLPAFAGAEERVLIERKVLVKQSRIFVALGPTYLARGDYFTSPGIAASLSYYPIETGGLDLRISGLFSSANASAMEMLDRAGARADTQRPVATAMLGWRHSLGYGKFLVGDRVNSAIHFDLQVGGHLGAMITDRSTNPAMSMSAGVLARWNERLFFILDVPLVLSLEARQNSRLAVGAMPLLQVGMQL